MYSNVVAFPMRPRPNFPPYARGVEWNRQRTPSRIVHVYTGTAGMDRAAEQMAWSQSCRDRRYRDPPALFAALPCHKQPAGYDWSFVAGFDVAIHSLGQPETDVSLLHLARLILEVGAALVVLPLSGARLEIFRRDGQGAVWKMA